MPRCCKCDKQINYKNDIEKYYYYKEFEYTIEKKLYKFYYVEDFNKQVCNECLDGFLKIEKDKYDATKVKKFNYSNSFVKKINKQSKEIGYKASIDIKFPNDFEQGNIDKLIDMIVEKTEF